MLNLCEETLRNIYLISRHHTVSIKFQKQLIDITTFLAHGFPAINNIPFILVMQKMETRVAKSQEMAAAVIWEMTVVMILEMTVVMIR